MSCAQNDLSPPSSSDPLPSQVALEDAALRTAMQLSITDCQQHQRDRMIEEYESDLIRAVSESEHGQRQESAARELEESLLTIACEHSLVEVQYREQITMTDEQYDDALTLALEQSTQESYDPTKSEEDCQIHQALAESKALAEYQEANLSEEELLEKAMAESLAEEEKQKAHCRELEILAISRDADLIEEIKRLSLKQHQQQLQEQDATESSN